MAKSLSFAPGYTYYREPDNPDLVPGAKFPWRWLYLPSGRSDPEFAGHLGRALRGEVVTPHTMSEDVGPLLGRLPPAWAARVGARLPWLYRRQPGVLLKLVFSNLALEWFADEAPAGRQIHVLRHPCGTYASWARLGWEPRPDRLLADDELVADHLAPYAEVMREATTFWERAGALWAATTLVVTRQLDAHPDWVLVQHEWLCEDPVARFASLYRVAGLRWNAAADDFLRAADRSGDGGPQSLVRSSQDEIDKWRRYVAPDDVAACRAVVERFDLPWYPDFAPTPVEPAWALRSAP